jgi:CDP-glycerol glycerophosphotransferase (TagB/SpsB family)
LIEALRELPNIQIVIKPHPNESSSWHKKHLKEWEVSAVILPPKSETNAAIHACDLFIAVHSTTIIEALLLGKLVIVVNLWKQPDILPWVKEGAVLGVYDPQELAPVIKKALLNKEAIHRELANQSKFVYNHTYKNDGKATERVIAVIKRYLTPVSS